MSARMAAAPTGASTLPWEVFICRACGLLYDESKGDEDGGLPPDTRFADIPVGWARPLCGVGKADFEPYLMEAQQALPRPAALARTASGARGARDDAGTVIVGAGRTGWQMAQALRGQDADMPITIATACNGDVYDKPLLSVALARGISPQMLPREAGVNAARRLKVRLLAQTHAVRVSAGSRQLRTSRGTLRYQQLVLAHGAEARQLPQFPPALCWRINHLQAYARFRAVVAGAPQRIVVVGAGLIGSELANDLALVGHRVTLLDIAARPLAAVLGEAASQQLIDAWKTLPIVFAGHTSVKSVALLPGGKKQISTEGGIVYRADQVVLAAGLQAPNRLAQSAGLAWANGIAVDAGTLATSVAGIYALGDCISIAGEVSRHIEPIGQQARTLAARILGHESRPSLQTRVPLRIKTTSLPLTV